MCKNQFVPLCLFLCITMNVFGCSDRNTMSDQGEKSVQKEENREANHAGKKLTDNSLEIKVNELIKEMSIEEKVAQLFIITPEALTNVGTVIEAGSTTKDRYIEFPVGGIVYFSNNLQSESQVKEMLSNMQSYAMERNGFPIFLGVDEEGGSVTRIEGKEGFYAPEVGNMWDIGLSGDSARAYETGKTLGGYLSSLGFNLNFAPVGDVLSNPDNAVIGKRSFGTDCNMVADMVVNELLGMKECNIKGVIKHFPGHGSTSGDTHEGSVYTEKTLDEMLVNEIVPFQKAIENQVEFIMVGHFSAPNITQDSIPCSLSKVIVTDILRDRLGYIGIIITDALNMGAVTQQYGSDAAAEMALVAGNDMLLMPDNFTEAYYGVLEAINSGRISEERIDESVRRILNVKMEMTQE